MEGRAAHHTLRFLFKVYTWIMAAEWRKKWAFRIIVLIALQEYKIHYIAIHYGYRLPYWYSWLPFTEFLGVTK